MNIAPACATGRDGDESVDHRDEREPTDPPEPVEHELRAPVLVEPRLAGRRPGEHVGAQHVAAVHHQRAGPDVVGEVDRVQPDRELHRPDGAEHHHQPQPRNRQPCEPAPQPGLPRGGRHLVPAGPTWTRWRGAGLPTRTPTRPCRCSCHAAPFRMGRPTRADARKSLRAARTEPHPQDYPAPRRAPSPPPTPPGKLDCGHPGNVVRLPAPRACSSAGERCLHTAEVAGSKPATPTSTNGLREEAVSRLRQQIASTTALRVRHATLGIGNSSGFSSRLLPALFYSDLLAQPLIREGAVVDGACWVFRGLATTWQIDVVMAFLGGLVVIGQTAPIVQTRGGHGPGHCRHRCR